VYSPQQSPAPSTAPLPVLFYIHAGGFTSGSGSLDEINGQDLAYNTSAIVVTVNYRLGALGFLALQELADETPAIGTGNYGLLDQLAALRWVKAHIEAFGGNPSRVTIMGNSAGAMSVIAHLCNTASRGLYSNAIASSPVFLAKPAAVANASGAAFVAASGCFNATEGVANCLRALPASALIAVSMPGMLPWLPVIDSITIKEPLIDSLSSGAFVHVPLVLGTTSDEGTVITYQGTQPVPPESYSAQLATLFPSYSSQALSDLEAQYPSHAGDNRDQLSKITSDSTFTCPARRAQAAAAAYTLSSGYVFYGVPACVGIYANMGAFHSSDILYLFHHPEAFNCLLGSQDNTLAFWMRQYYAALLSHGDLNAAGTLPSWPAVAGGLMGSHPQGLAVESDYRSSFCPFWDTHEGPFS
jgi:para-nitrobenzyl esterase